ncbi:MAG: hypothetical protein A2010_13850 [Nitrospirae bacterium GWD2_57_9]|nr:MAG: hypothetical protein A2010_13850 [Nitrospirae bacterium GWD2_57_9]
MNKKTLRDIFQDALGAVDPRRAVARVLAHGNGRLAVGRGYQLDAFDRIVVVGAGKATAGMAAAAEEALGDRIREGLIIVPYGQTAGLKIIRQREASHPVPDEAGVEATGRLLDLVQEAGEGTLVICLLSGGGSALLVQPPPGITLQEKQRVTELLLRAGASIAETNTVRKHLSLIKGGRLARTAFPATVLTLILSDVIGNPIDVIASGPTAPDRSTYRDASAVIDKYRLKQQLPPAVNAWIERGTKEQEAETPKSGDSCFSRTENIIVAGIELALSAAKARSQQLGLAAELVTSELRGEAREAAHLLAGRALDIRKALAAGGHYCILSGGETTVTVQGEGTGGRNQELALAFALDVEGVPGITLLSAGTDGIDGPTRAAGAIVDGDTAKKARAAGMDPAAYLERNDSYSFFEQLDRLTAAGSHLVTGPTGTNVMDLQIVCIEKEE